MSPTPPPRPNRIAQSRQGGGSVSSIPHYVSVDFAHATETVLYVMCGIMAFAGLVALRGLHVVARRWCPSHRRVGRPHV